jgi:hypothetical protein
MVSRTWYAASGSGPRRCLAAPEAIAPAAPVGGPSLHESSKADPFSMICPQRSAPGDQHRRRPVAHGGGVSTRSVDLRRVVTRRRRTGGQRQPTSHNSYKIAGKPIPVLTVNLVDKRMNGLPKIAHCPSLPSQPRWRPQGRSTAPITAPTNSETRRDLLSVSATS